MKFRFNRRFNRANFNTDKVYIIEENETLKRLDDVVYFTKDDIIRELKTKVSDSVLYELMYNSKSIPVELIYSDMTLKFIFLENEEIDLLSIG